MSGIMCGPGGCEPIEDEKDRDILARYEGLSSEEIEARLFSCEIHDVSRREGIAFSAARLMDLIGTYCPPSRETSLAYTKIEEAVMWASRSLEKEMQEHLDSKSTLQEVAKEVFVDEEPLSDDPSDEDISTDEDYQARAIMLSHMMHSLGNEAGVLFDRTSETQRYCGVCGQSSRRKPLYTPHESAAICKQCVAKCLSAMSMDRFASPPARDIEGPKQYCNFCGRHNGLVDNLVQASHAFRICNYCVDVVDETFAEKSREADAEAEVQPSTQSSSVSQKDVLSLDDWGEPDVEAPERDSVLAELSHEFDTMFDEAPAKTITLRKVADMLHHVFGRAKTVAERDKMSMEILRTIESHPIGQYLDYNEVGDILTEIEISLGLSNVQSGKEMDFILLRLKQKMSDFDSGQKARLNIARHEKADRLICKAYPNQLTGEEIAAKVNSLIAYVDKREDALAGEAAEGRLILQDVVSQFHKFFPREVVEQNVAWETIDRLLEKRPLDHVESVASERFGWVSRIIRQALGVEPSINERASLYAFLFGEKFVNQGFNDEDNDEAIRDFGIRVAQALVNNAWEIARGDLGSNVRNAIEARKVLKIYLERREILLGD